MSNINIQAYIDNNTCKAKISTDVFSKDDKYAFYLYEDGIKIEQKWYSKESIVQFDAKLDNCKNYSITGFVRDKNNNILFRKTIKINHNITIISARTDGIGARLRAIIFAIYLSRKLNCKFNYIWSSIDNYIYCPEKMEIMPGNKKRDIDDENCIFDEEFIQKYSYKDKIKITAGNNTKIAKIIKGEIRADESIYFADNVEVGLRVLKDKKALEDYKKIFDEIKFNKNITDLFNKSKNTVRQYMPFIALHLRTGDIFYSPLNWDVGDIYKGINLEVACEIIENQIKLNNKILIFSDNSHVTNYLTSKYGNNHIIDFYNLQNGGGYSLTSTQEALFELIAMSEAKIIYGTDSNFSISASYIGGAEFLNIYRIFDPKQLFNIIKSRINDDFIDKIFKGYSYYCLYRFGKKINLNLKELLAYIEKAIFYNPKNNSYYLAKLSLLLELKDFKGANEYFENYKDKLLDSYSLKRVVANHHLKKDICSIFFDYKFINISSLEIILNIRKLLEDYYFTSSLEMIKHDIRYHIGSLFLNYKKCYINILYFIFEIKKFPTYDNSIFSSEEKLSKFNDYNTLIVSQDYFIYKIGEIIFKNINKNLYKQIKTLIILYKIINKKDSYQDKIIKLNKCRL